MRRYWLATIMNLLVPGSGLVGLGRVWLGIAMAVWFTVGAELAVLGWLIAPLSLPTWMVAGGAGLAAIAWLAAQGLLIGRVRFLLDPELPRELKALCELAESEMSQGNLAAARSALRAALMVNDSDLDARILWARLASVKGRRSKARRAWLAARRLDTQQLFSAEIRQALDRL